MKILVVEDEHQIANSIKKGFEREHFIVDTAFSGTEGLDLASEDGYDAIILDIMLPGISGFEMIKSLRREENHTPILVLTAKGRSEDKVEGLKIGADDYLTKPFSFEELVARVRALTRRSYISTGDTIKIGNLTMNLDSREVKIGKKEIYLSSKEFSILEYLIKNKGIAISKDKIVNHIWKYDSDILPNTVEVHIRNLRKKLSGNSKNLELLIQTVRGFGYKIS